MDHFIGWGCLLKQSIVVAWQALGSPTSYHFQGLNEVIIPTRTLHYFAFYILNSYIVVF